jgi:nucleoside-diphosphate-sugar epimerase
MPRALVTGATGFIGSHLVRSLIAQGQQVRCLIRRTPLPSNLSDSGIEIESVTADLDDAGDLHAIVRGCDVVYHLAGRTSALHRRDLYRTNGWGSYALAEACARQASPPVLVIVSSLAAAGTGVAGRPRADGDPARPISEYGRSKRAGELAACRWAEHVPISIVRPGIVFGPGNRDMLPIFQSIARFRVHMVPGFAPRRVALIHQNDLADLLLRVARRGRRLRSRRSDEADSLLDRSTGYYFASTAEFPTYAELGRMIGLSLNRSRTLIMSVSEPLALLAAASNQWWNRLLGKSDTFNLDKMREAFAGDWTHRIERLCDELAFQPAAPLQTRLDQTARWYIEHGWIVGGRSPRPQLRAGRWSPVLVGNGIKAPLQRESERKPRPK